MAAPPPPRLLLEQADDTLLASRAAEGDVPAFTVLMRRHGPALRAYALRLSGVRADADDVVQTAFETAWRKLPELREPSAVRSWLYRITATAAQQVNRSRRPESSIEGDQIDVPFESAGPDRSAEQDAQLRALSAALGRLPEQQRRAWLLREVGGLDYQEIAEQLDAPASTVRGLLARARRTLVDEMEEWR